MKKLVLFFLSIAFSFFAITLWMQETSSQLMAHEICDLVNEHYFHKDANFESWYKDCKNFADRLPRKLSPEDVASKTNDILIALKTSHLSIYTPQEDRQIWHSEYKTHGITFLNLEGRVFVNRLYESSPAYKLGVRFGDELIEINSQSNLDQLDLNSSEGWFKFKRKDKEFLVNLIGAEFVADESPQLIKHKNFFVLEIPSFRKEFFEEEALTKLLKELKALKLPYVLDLRQNQGGSFVAMLRFASSLFCSPTLIGELLTSQKENFKEIQDDMRDEFLIQDVNTISKIYLKTFAGYSCEAKPKAVWVSQQTMSVAEILTDSLKNKLNVKVMGEQTSGRVVVGVWYKLVNWPEGFTLSIPQANFINTEGKELEHIGVSPNVKTKYNLSDLLRGTDSFVLATEQLINY